MSASRVSAELASAPAAGAAALEVRPRRFRHWRQWVAAAVVLLLLGSLANSLWTNPRLERATIWEYLFKDLTLRGVGVTLYLTVICMVIGIVGGVVLAVMRLSDNRVLSGVASLYLWIFRGTPVLIQLIFWGYLGALYPQLTIGIPFTDVTLISGDANVLVTATTAAILALGLNEIAYASEIIRAGILGVDEGQREAAEALGMSNARTMRRIVLPQAMRTIVPPMGNEVITMLKTTALVSVISGHDLLTNLQNVYSQTFEVIPLLVVASIWYLAITSILSVFQSLLEHRYGRGVRRRDHDAARRRPWRRAPAGSSVGGAA